jgi:hypothetical protein
VKVTAVLVLLWSVAPPLVPITPPKLAPPWKTSVITRLVATLGAEVLVTATV